ncbi:hypothetical protein ESY86_19430 [Subsaximicrobium wynnwilliamsii]|uniref:Uncharacterized protein n=1 Tax=Subsaximicrobium wynnwilliamsii TaxID=291179 RepID=A0A5C6ZCJ5_9FLAO|nr:hypothetical protein [Subsaximicrobium wynnwilliamsii]TXD81028.1 hypothetical protein ESY87_19600 [Subsaximicrobium wynnwilliamsii]TXD86745.1 hypothetical protein ESY86_19430 [Subsaximicrobium wynnwilliamsii]TXE00350.1 hypothetical protein ESY88_19590 [Subsaximicrobium wynnwilliamsii]
MYKLFSLFLVLLFTSLTLNAQNSKEEYEKAVDYCACKIAYAYTEDFASKNPRLDEKKSFDEVISIQLNDCDKKNVSSSELEKLLKENKFNGFSKTLIPDVKKAKNSYSDNFNKEEAINSILNSFELSFDKIEIKSELSNGLNNKLQSFEKQEDIVEEIKSETTTNPNLLNEINHSDRVINEGSVETSENSFFPNWLLFAIILLASILLFLNNHLKIKKLKESAKRHRDEIEVLKNEKSIFNQSNNKSQNNSRFERDIYQKIEDVNDAIRKLQSKNTSKNLHPITSQKNQVKNIPQTNQKEIQKFVYAKTPISDKVFNALDVTENKDGKFYKFLIKDNNVAEFQFFNTENSAIRAVNAPDSFLYPACEETEPLNQNAKKIITNKPGVAIKQGEKWIVKEKAQITYE